MLEFYTIGVYNSTESEFFKKIIDNKIDVFCDIRQRRGVRGSKYSFVNSNKLQMKLKEFEIIYEYIQGLAPTSEIRDLQKQADIKLGERKSERTQLGETFVNEYESKVLKVFNFERFLENLNEKSAKRVVLFCVEEGAEACHRSLVTQKLVSDYHLKTTHL